MNRNRKDKFIMLPVEIIKMIPPDILNIARVHESMAIRRLLDKHHGRQIIDVPVGRDLYEASLIAFSHGLHPFVRFLRVVDLGPVVAGTKIVGLTVLVAHAVIIFDAIIEEQLGALFAGFPPRFSLLGFVYRYYLRRRQVLPWRNATSRWLSSKLCQHPVRFIQDVSLLLDGHILRVLVRISVESNFVARIANSRHLLRERFQGVAWDKPCCLDAIFVEELQQSLSSHRGRPDTCGAMSIYMSICSTEREQRTPANITC